MTATGNEPVKLSQLKTALEGIGSGGGMRLVKATMSDGVITPPDGVDVSGAEYVFIAPGMYDREELDVYVYPFTTLLKIQEVDSEVDAKQQPFPIRTSSGYVYIDNVALVLMNGVYTLHLFQGGKYDVKCTPYFILTQ